MTNETGLQFQKPTIKELEDLLKSEDDTPVIITPDGKVKRIGEPDLLEQIDMSHAEIIRRARNEGLEEAAKFVDALAIRKAGGHGQTSYSRMLEETAYFIRSRISGGRSDVP